MNFYGRKKELDQLVYSINQDKLQTVLIYGRRRIGKSELVKQAIRQSDYQSVYYECKQTTQQDNVESINYLLSEIMNLPLLGYQKIEQVLDYLFSLSKEKKIIFVIDEYPYLRDCTQGMDSILQSLIDKYHDQSKMTLIILGSSIEIMKSLLEKNNPLFGRIDRTIELQQMDYFDSALFYTNYSYEDRIRMYSVFGGVPYYNALVDDKKSVKQNIIDLVSSPGARLEHEVSIFLQSELSKIVNANETFGALSKGYSKQKDIEAQSHVSSKTTLNDILEKLIKLGLVKKAIPINEPENSKKTHYHISDNLASFYFRYIFRYSSQRTVMNPETFYDKYIQQDFEEQLIPKCFEEISKQYLIRMNMEGKLNPLFNKIGGYYYDNPQEHSNGEFDIVTQDEEGYIFYEVKFHKKPLDRTTIEQEKAQVNKTKLKCHKYGFVSSKGFNTDRLENEIFISLVNLFED